jgi:uncharacterized protein (DUF362 family)
MSEKQGTSRRDFIKTCVVGTAVLGAGDALAFAKAVKASPVAKSKVVIAKDAMLRGGDGKADPKRMAALLDRAMTQFYGKKNPVDPWKMLVHPGQVVGLKINVAGRAPLSTSNLLVDAICERLQQAGIKPYDIIVWDKTDLDLKKGGYTSIDEPGKVRCFGCDKFGYEDQPENFGVVSSKLSKILTRMCDVVINVPILKDHMFAGVTASMKNMYGVIHNPRECHGNQCNPYVADVNMLPTIRKKVRFTICDATSACYHGGPGYKPEYVWQPNSLIVASDPVALDYTAWQIVDRKRVEKGLKTLEADGRPPKYIATAADAQHKLGTDDPKQISVVEV